MRRLLNQERGSVLVTAMLVLAVMMSLALAVASQVDTQTKQSRVERERESTFNLAEAALSAQTFILGRRGTGLATHQYPLQGCSKTPPADDYYCPVPAQIEKSYNGAGQVDFDFASTTDGWRTYVRDDSDPVTGKPVLYWDDSIIDPSNPKYSTWARYDADGNRFVWVRSEAIVRGRKRAIVAWVRIEDRVVSFPQYAVLAGKVSGDNAGGHGGRPLVNSTGSALGIAVRCGSAPQSPPDPTCIDLNPTKGPQLQPPTNFHNNYPNQSALDDVDALDALESVARGNGTYYAGCPANPNGKVVVVENAGDCRYLNSAPAAPGQAKCCNSMSAPGLFVVKHGKVDFGGNIEFWGVVYNANLDNLSDIDMVETSGTAAIHGGALVDGNGGVYAGSAGDNIVFFAQAFENISAVGTAGVVQNTWREIVNPR
jgi:type II secretory pathway pseudopilin PulG